MPTISYFFGIYILMHVREHAPPHFHAEYHGQEAQIHIQTGEVIKGKLPPQALRLVEEWRRLHVSELQENWDNARQLMIPKKNSTIGVAMYYHIRDAVCIKDYYVHLQFEDGLRGVVNFEKIAGKGEAFSPLADLDYFCRMKLGEISHTVEWPNGADICPQVLYESVKNAPNHISTLTL